MKFSVTVPPGTTGSLVNVLVINNDAPVTVRASVAFPELTCGKVPVSSSPETLVWVPTTVPLISTETVQIAPPATVMPVNEIVDPPAGAVSVATGQVVVALAGLAISVPEGRLSVNVGVKTVPTFAELSMVNVNVDRPPKLTEAGEKDFENPGLAATTVRSSDAVPALPIEDVKVPVVLVCVPTVLEVTSTVIVQVPPIPIPPFVKVIVPPPAGAVSVGAVVPAQFEIERLEGLAIVIAAGSVSVNATLEIAPVWLLVISNRSVVTLPGPTVSGVNVLVNVGTACA